MTIMLRRCPPAVPLAGSTVPISWVKMAAMSASTYALVGVQVHQLERRVEGISKVDVLLGGRSILDVCTLRVR